MKKPGRPRKKYPRASFVKRLLRKRTPWKVIEWKTGCSRRTIRREVLPSPEIILPASEDCDDESEIVEVGMQAA